MRSNAKMFWMPNNDVDNNSKKKEQFFKHTEKKSQSKSNRKNGRDHFSVRYAMPQSPNEATSICWVQNLSSESSHCSFSAQKHIKTFQLNAHPLANIIILNAYTWIYSYGSEWWVVRAMHAIPERICKYVACLAARMQIEIAPICTRSKRGCIEREGAGSNDIGILRTTTSASTHVLWIVPHKYCILLFTWKLSIARWRTIDVVDGAGWVVADQNHFMALAEGMES